MAGRPRADFRVGRVRREAARIPDRGRIDDGELPEEPFRAPEAAHSKDGLVQSHRKRRHDAMAVHKMLLRDPQWRAESGQGLLDLRHRGLLAYQRHSGPPEPGEPTVWGRLPHDSSPQRLASRSRRTLNWGRMGICQQQNLRTPQIEKLRHYGILLVLQVGDYFYKHLGLR